MDFDAIYMILAAIARNGILLTYGGLSTRYYETTGDWHEPHGSWDEPLGQLNQMLHSAGWPALSAVVVLQSKVAEFGEPGGGFWESSPNIPARPTNADRRTAQWGQLLNMVYEADWPNTIPTTPPM
jgi:hypothetical protein